MGESVKQVGKSTRRVKIVIISHCLGMCTITCGSGGLMAFKMSRF